MWSTFDFGTAFLVFVAYAVVDALFARYTLAVAELNEWKAATTGLLTHILLAFGVIHYTQNYLYVLPILGGSWIGTFFFVRKERINRKNKNDETPV